MGLLSKSGGDDRGGQVPAIVSGALGDYAGNCGTGTGWDYADPPEGAPPADGVVVRMLSPSSVCSGGEPFDRLNPNGPGIRYALRSKDIADGQSKTIYFGEKHVPDTDILLASGQLDRSFGHMGSGGEPGGETGESTTRVSTTAMSWK